MNSKFLTTAIGTEAGLVLEKCVVGSSFPSVGPNAIDELGVGWKVFDTDVLPYLEFNEAFNLLDLSFDEFIFVRGLQHLALGQDIFVG